MSKRGRKKRDRKKNGANHGKRPNSYVDIRAEMVAQVHSILVEPGANVAVGDTLLLLESMKMEIPVLVEVAGIVADIPVHPGDVVHEGDVLVTMLD